MPPAIENARAFISTFPYLGPIGVFLQTVVVDIILLMNLCVYIENKNNSEAR